MSNTNQEREPSSELSGNPGALDDELAEVLASLGRPLPADYLVFLKQSNGAEGFVGETYLIMWRAQDLEQFNVEYEVNEYTPGLLLFGSNCGGEGFAFDMRANPWAVVQVPFVGIDHEYAIRIADSFSEFLATLRGAAQLSNRRRKPNRGGLLSMEIFEINPVILGGDPTDSANKAMLTRQQHFEAVRFWNKIIRDIKAKNCGNEKRP